MEELYIDGHKIKPVENAECAMYFGYKAAVLTINDLKFDILIKKDDLKKIKDVYNLNNTKTQKPIIEEVTTVENVNNKRCGKIMGKELKKIREENDYYEMMDLMDGVE